MDLAGKRILIVGFGKTGEALAGFLLRRGARVTISEMKTEEALGGRILAWKERGAVFETGGHRLETFLGSELIVPSPGAASLPFLRASQEKGIPVISEIELAYRFLRGRIVGITGTNGKSTTATLAHKILKDGGLKSRLAGNIGKPLVSFVAGSRDDHIYVTEISSFQLEHVRHFRSAISVFLNISPNHLDWHGSFASYLAAKKRLFENQDKTDLAILNRDDRLVWKTARETRAEVLAFSRRVAVIRGCDLDDGWLVLRDGTKKERLIKTDDIPLPGDHNRDNVMAAALIGHALGVDTRAMRPSIRSFAGLEHRLEHVLTYRGVRFVNDSKATTVDATLKALLSFDRRIVLILGGRDKGADFSRLRREVRARAKRVILLGEAREKIERALKGAVPLEKASTLREAIRKAFDAAAAGEVVLLSPACASFDMFKNFEARGRAFKKEVCRLRESFEKGRA